MIKAIIVDEEIAAGKFLKKLIEATCPDIDIVGIANDNVSALVLISEVKPDLLLLDIKMIQQNELSYFDINKTPEYDIIILAKDENCAFLISKISSVHCIAKPVQAADLIIAVARCVLKTANKLIYMQQSALNTTAPVLIVDRDKISVFVIDKYLVLYNRNIICCKAAAGYTEIYCKHIEKPYLVSFPLGVVQTWFPAKDFLRIHRSSLISVSYFASFNKTVTEVTLKNGMILDIAASLKNSFLALLGNK